MEITGRQIKNATVQREDLDTTTVGKAVVAKILQGSGIQINSTGADSGTGDVYISADFLNLGDNLFATDLAYEITIGGYYGRGTTGNGFPTEGFVLGYTSVTSKGIQLLITFAGGELRTRRFNPDDDSWSPWIVSGGSGAGATITVNTNTSATYTETAFGGQVAILHNAASTNIVHTLPSAVFNTAVLTIKKTDSSANTITINTVNGQTIDGGISGSAILRRQYEAITLISNGSDWLII